MPLSASPHEENLSLVTLTAAGKKRHEEMRMPHPFNIITGVIYESDGATVVEIVQRSRMPERKVRSHLNVLMKKGMISVQDSHSTGPERITL